MAKSVSVEEKESQPYEIPNQTESMEVDGAEATAAEEEEEEQEDDPQNPPAVLTLDAKTGKVLYKLKIKAKANPDFSAPATAPVHPKIDYDSCRELLSGLKTKEIRFISSLDFVLNYKDEYFTEKDGATKISYVTLMYPSGAVEKFPLISPRKEGYNPLIDLRQTLVLLSEDFPGFFGHNMIFRDLLKGRLYEMDALRLLVSQWNDYVWFLIEEYKKQGKNLVNFIRPRLTEEQANILGDQIYARVVTIPEALRQYTSFTKEVYGETGNQIVYEILRKCNVKKNSLFVDLGSGIGNVVFLVAAVSGCKCFGVEFLPAPFTFSRMQNYQFNSRMLMYGRSVGKNIELVQADFLTNQRVHEYISQADIVFCNNYAFEVDVNVRLGHIYMRYMKEGAYLVTFKEYGQVNHVINERNVDDISSMLDVEKVPYVSNCVSWTHSGGYYFIHKINRLKREEFIRAMNSRT